MTPRTARLLLGCTGVLLVAATAWALLQSAQWRLTVRLRDSAAHELALAAAGGTPYRWRLNDPGDIIAGRVFFARDGVFGPDELVVTSDGRAFEVGLVLARPVDVGRFSGLRLPARCDPAGMLSLRVRERLDAPEFASAAIPCGATRQQLSLDLATIGWTSGGRPSGSPRAAAMLRLSFAMPPGGVVRLNEATLDRTRDMRRIDLQLPVSVVEAGANAHGETAVYRLPAGGTGQQTALATLAALDARQQLPVLLPQAGSIEQQLALRNAVYARLPGAILIPATALAETFSRARALVHAPPGGGERHAVRWPAVLAYVLTLALFRLRPPGQERLRALVEVLLALAGPLWLILGDGFDGNPDVTQTVLIASIVLYAVSLSVPRPWRWAGSARAWGLAAGVVALTTVCALAFNGMQGVERAMGHAQLARYLVWALFQQYLICGVCTERWLVVTGSKALAVYLGALGFALLHFPNGALMLATLAGGLCWCALYLRERALLPLAASHAACAIVLLGLLPREMLWSAEVSVRFFQ